MNQYSRTVAAALAETSSKFTLAEALARDIPPRPACPSVVEEQSVSEYLEDARQAIIDAGGEPKAVSTLAMYRKVALWVMIENQVRPNPVSDHEFRWVKGSSYSAHRAAFGTGLSYEEFAAHPKTERALMHQAGRPAQPLPRTMVSSWSPQQKAEAAALLADDPEVTVTARAQTAKRLLADPKVRDQVPATWPRQFDQPTNSPAIEPSAPAEALPRRTERDYDALIEQHVNGLSVALAAESSGRWKPSEHAEALLYFLTQILGNRREPVGEQAEFVNDKLDNLFDEVEAYANGEAS